MAKRGNKAGARTPNRTATRSVRRPVTPTPAPRTPSAREALTATTGPWSSHLLALTSMFTLMGAGFFVVDPSGDTSRMWVLAAGAGIATLLLYQTWGDNPRFTPQVTKVLTVTAVAAFGLLVARALGVIA